MGHSAMGPAFRELHPWDEGRLVGAKQALKQQQVWAIRFWLDQHRRLRDRALFDLAIDSKLRGCDVVKVRIEDLVSGGRVRDRANIVQKQHKRQLRWRGGWSPNHPCAERRYTSDPAHRISDCLSRSTRAMGLILKPALM